jgi:RNA-directed DNA polymerase
VRYADDLLVVCRSRGQAQAALARLRVLLAGLGLQPKEAKTRIVHLVEGGEGFHPLGFHHRLVRSRAVRGTGGLVYLARWPSRRSVQHARDRIRFLTMRVRLAAPVEQIVQEVNGFLRGWSGTFATATRPGRSTRSGNTPSCGSRCLWPSAISGAGHGASPRSIARRTAWG